MTPLPQPATAAPTMPSVYDFPRAVQDQVDTWKQVLEVGRKEGRQGMVRMARELGEGFSVVSQYKKLAAWDESGRTDWRVFIDRRAYPDMWACNESAAVLPAEFVRWAAGQLLGNQRKSRPAYRQIIARWKRWRSGMTEAAIPGYGVCPRVGPNGKHPVGWSYANLMRRCDNGKAEIVMARIGSAAARAHLPCVPGTREGARWLEFVFFDDVWLDRLVLPTGYLRPVRVLQLGGLDLATGYYLKFGQRPDGIADTEGVRERLKRRDFLCLVAALLDEYGYPAEYDMHLILERGTATMSIAEARVLYDVSDGRIKVGYTSMDGRMVLAWDEAKSGNSRGKGMLESWHHIFQNEQASLPGQVGKDRDHSPAMLSGVERETSALVKVGAMLPPDVRNQLRMPIPTMAECYLQTLDLVRRVNERTDHECEGFGTVMLWRVPGTREWREERELVDENGKFKVPESLVAQLEWSPRKESPAERKARLSHGVAMRRLPQNIWHRFYEDSHHLTKVRLASIEVPAGGRKLLFGPVGPEDPANLPDGTEVLAYYAPNDPQVVHLTVSGRYAGSWPRLERVRRGDAAAVADGIRRSRAYLAHAAASVQTKMAEQILAEERRMADNAQIIAEAGGAGGACTPLGGACTQQAVPAPHFEDQGTVTTTGAEALQAMGKTIAARSQSQRRDAAQAAEDILDSAPMIDAEAAERTTGVRAGDELLDAIIGG